MWAWLKTAVLAFLAYIKGRDAGIVLEKQKEQTATLNAVETRANVEVNNAALSNADRRERLSKWTRP